MSAVSRRGLGPRRPSLQVYIPALEYLWACSPVVLWLFMPRLSRNSQSSLSPTEIMSLADDSVGLCRAWRQSSTIVEIVSFANGSGLVFFSFNSQPGSRLARFVICWLGLVLAFRADVSSIGPVWITTSSTSIPLQRWPALDRVLACRGRFRRPAAVVPVDLSIVECRSVFQLLPAVCVCVCLSLPVPLQYYLIY